MGIKLKADLFLGLAVVLVLSAVVMTGCTKSNVAGKAYAATCTDSDGGQVGSVKGTCTDSALSQTDSCFSLTRVTEWYCNPSHYCNPTSIDCSGATRCIDGACKKLSNCYLSRYTMNLVKGSASNVITAAGGCPSKYAHWGTKEEVKTECIYGNINPALLQYIGSSGTPTYFPSNPPPYVSGNYFTSTLNGTIPIKVGCTVGRVAAVNAVSSDNTYAWCCINN